MKNLILFLPLICVAACTSVSEILPDGTVRKVNAMGGKGASKFGGGETVVVWNNEKSFKTAVNGVVAVSGIAGATAVGLATEKTAQIGAVETSKQVASKEATAVTGIIEGEKTKRILGVSANKTAEALGGAVAP